MEGILFTERGIESVIRRKENQLIAKGYKNARSTYPFRLRVWEYTIQHSSVSRNQTFNPLKKRLIAWMRPDE